MLRRLISSDFAATRDNHGNLFIDRDGPSFSSILYLLRNQQLPVIDSWEGFLLDIAYYGLSDLLPADLVLELPFKTSRVEREKDPRGQLQAFAAKLEVGGSSSWVESFCLKGKIVVPVNHSQPVQALEQIKVFLMRWDAEFQRLAPSRAANLEFRLPATPRKLKNSHSPFRGEEGLSDSILMSVTRQPKSECLVSKKISEGVLVQ